MGGKGFISGGTVQAGGGIYVERQADQELYDLCLAGKYASVLAARQRGKSSLMANVTEKLKKISVHVATVDISPFGETDNPDQWYSSILEIIASQLGLDIDLTDWWEEQTHKYPIRARRFKLFFQNEVLKTLPGRVVIFIDEIDKTLTLPFTDDFFIGIREMYNSRSQDAEFQRLSFVLLGVASPNDLIKSDTSTPYNISEQIELTDFTLEDLQPFVEALTEQLRATNEQARLIAYWTFHWTDGHPYLSNRLLKVFSERMAAVTNWNELDIPTALENLVKELFLKRLTGSIDNNIMEVKQRLDLRKLEANGALDLYLRILFSPLPIWDAEEEFEPKTYLKLAGVIKSLDGELTIRNRIYENVFGQDWMKEIYPKTFRRPLKIPQPPSKPEQPSPTAYDDWVAGLNLASQSGPGPRPGIPNPFVDTTPLSSSGLDRSGPFRVEDSAFDDDHKEKKPAFKVRSPEPPRRNDSDDLFDLAEFEEPADEPFLDLFIDDDIDVDLIEDEDESRSSGRDLLKRIRRRISNRRTADKPAKEPPSLLQRASRTPPPETSSETETPFSSRPVSPLSPRSGGTLLRRIERASSRPDAPSETSPETPDTERLAQTRRQTQVPPATGRSHVPADNYQDLKWRVQTKLLSELDITSLDPHSPEVRSTIEELFSAILSEESIVLARNERRRLFEVIVAEILGFGPLEPLLDDDTITTIMVNGPKNVYIERAGNLMRVNTTFEDDAHVLRVLDRILAPLGRRVDETSPMVNFRLPDGSRGTAVIRPVSLAGPSLTIRKFSKRPLTVEDLIRFGSMTPEIAEFLRACIIAQISVLVVGNASAGKTTLVNVLSGFIPNDERIITIENVAELQLRQEHVLTLETLPPNIEGQGEITIAALADVAMSMSPNRIVFGSLRRRDIDSYIDTALQTSTLATLAAAVDTEAALRLLESGVLNANPNLGIDIAREWIGGAIQMVVVQQRLRDGTRKIMQVLELSYQGRGRYGIEPVFQFEQTGMEAGKIIGRIRPSGYRPSFMSQIENAGIHLPPTVFGIGNSRY